FQNGRASNALESSAGGLKIGDPNPISNGPILVENNIFRNNTAQGNGFSQAVGGLVAATDADGLIVRNNLFVGNQSPNNAAAYLYSNNEIDVANNTFVLNQATDATLAKRVIVGYVSLTAAILSNNILFGNATGPGAFDIDRSATFNGFAGATLRNNDIEAETGTAVAESATLHVDPPYLAPFAY